MSRWWTLVKLDATLAVRHKLVHVVVIVAALFGALIGFAAPEQLEHGGIDYLVDATPDGALRELLAEAPAERVFDSRERLREAVASERNSIGIVFEGSAETPRATVYIQGSESPARRALIRTGVDAVWQHVGAGQGPPTPPTVLDPGARKPAFSDSLVPILFALDLCILGFMFASVMVLQDKEQGVIGLYRVSPGGTIAYVAAKLTVNLGLSLLNLLVLVALAAPWALAKPAVYLVALLGCAGMTLLGIGLAVFVRNLAQFMYPLIVVGLLAATPMYMAFSPSTKLAWTWWLPTYHVLFGSEAAMFGGGPALRSALLFNFGFLLTMALFAGFAVERRLMKEIG